jgi:antirestriction protein
VGKSEKDLFLEEYEKHEKISCMVIVIHLPTGAKEMIVNHSNIEGKMEYYKKAYNEKMELEQNNEVKIIGYLFY